MNGIRVCDLTNLGLNEKKRRILLVVKRTIPLWYWLKTPLGYRGLLWRLLGSRSMHLNKSNHLVIGVGEVVDQDRRLSLRFNRKSTLNDP